MHHGKFHNQPDPPADLYLQPPTITKVIGVKWPNHNIIGSVLIAYNRKRNSIDTINLIKSPVSIDNILCRKPRFSDWI